MLNWEISEFAKPKNYVRQILQNVKPKIVEPIERQSQRLVWQDKNFIKCFFIRHETDLSWLNI